MPRPLFAVEKLVVDQRIIKKCFILLKRDVDDIKFIPTDPDTKHINVAFPSFFFQIPKNSMRTKGEQN